MYVCPITFGTESGFSPFETLIRTFVPTRTIFPDFGACAVIVFALASEKMKCGSALSWASASIDSAWVSVKPFTAGTVVRGAPVET